MFWGWETPAARRYTLRILGLSLAYGVVLFIAVKWFKSPDAPRGWLRYAIALTPALPVLGIIWAMGAFMVEVKDEYQRMRLAVSILWATGLTMAACTVWGFLQNFADVPGPPLYMVYVLFMGLFGLVQCAWKLFETIGRRDR